MFFFSGRLFRCPSSTTSFGFWQRRSAPTRNRSAPSTGCWSERRSGSCAAWRTRGRRRRRAETGGWGERCLDGAACVCEWLQTEDVFWGHWSWRERALKLMRLVPLSSFFVLPDGILNSLPSGGRRLEEDRRLGFCRVFFESVNRFCLLWTVLFSNSLCWRWWC